MVPGTPAVFTSVLVPFPKGDDATHVAGGISIGAGGRTVSMTLAGVDVQVKMSPDDAWSISRHLSPQSQAIKTDDITTSGKIALCYSGWQLIAERPDRPSPGDHTNLTRIKALTNRGFKHVTMEDGNMLSNGSRISGAPRFLVGADGFNSLYATDEQPLMQLGDEPLTDSLYSLNLALLGLREVFGATGGAARYVTAERALSDYLARIQGTSEAHPELAGSWFRAFDYDKWEYWAWRSWLRTVGDRRRMDQWQQHDGDGSM
jgi:hypothetical protein